MNTKQIKQRSFYSVIIATVSFLVPGLVAILFFLPQTGNLGKFDVSLLPHLNALLNSATAVALITGYIMIRQKKQDIHRISMISAFGLSSLFLISYVIYHFQGGHTVFGDVNGDQVLSEAERAVVGSTRGIYILILLSHIGLATIIVPFVLFSLYFGLTKQFSRHRKLSKWTFPLWLYVAVSGVVVYLMISPYY